MKDSAKNDGKAVTLDFAEGLSVTVVHNPEYEYLMTTSDVATGYGVSRNTISSHQSIHGDELKAGVHFIPAVEIFDSRSGQRRKITYWTKAGVIRLGFFIKSERAKMFRDWAEKVVLAVTAPQVHLPKAVRRNHNRMTPTRMVQILATVALVEDKQVRTALVQQLMPNLDIPGLQLELPFGGKGGRGL